MISGGRADLRRVLYMNALIGMRHNAQGTEFAKSAFDLLHHCF
jgi:hypothetical protein